MRLPLLAIGLLVLLSSPARSQEILYAEHKGHMHAVRRASRERPLIRVNDKLIIPSGSRFVLRKTKEFIPAFISVQRVKVRTVGTEIVGSGRRINNRFEFRGSFVSPYALQDVFVVLELMLEGDEKSLFLYEVGELEPRKPRSLQLTVPTSVPLGEGKYRLHVFVGGLEVLHSLQPFDQRERALNRMIAQRTQGLTDSDPKFFVGPVPEYPRSLRKAKTDGRVLVRARIRATGAVVDPEIIEATNPAFGESALEAVRQWRFLPRMKNGRPIDTEVQLPVEFESPDESDHDS